MPQVNLRTTRQFEIDLLTLMVEARIMNKTKAIRFAVHEVAAAFRRSDGGKAKAQSAPLPSSVMARECGPPR